MKEQPDISLSPQEPRLCPACGIEVAAKASECLMCGTSLVDAEEEESEEIEEAKRRVPHWVGSVVVVMLAILILAGGGFGLYSMLAVEPQPSPTVSPSLITPSPSPTCTASPTPTRTPLPTSTPTPLPPRTHTVQEYETMSDIAQSYGVAVDEILALNSGVDPELIRPDQVLLIPAVTPALDSGGAETRGRSTPTPRGFIIHVVQAGETLISIAEEYDVSVSLIRTANDLPPEDETIRADQSLLIPLGTPTPTPSPTPNPNATATPIRLYGSPPVLHPPDGAVFAGGETPVLLQWASIGVLRDDEWYQLSLSQPSGVVSDIIRTRATAWRVPLDLLRTVGTEMTEFRWQVQVVREVAQDTYETASPPSNPRSFLWRAPTPAATTTATSKP